jgi:tetratricopeptide (TPR) repeat protein
VFRYLDNDRDIAQARLETTNDEAFGYYEKVKRFDPGGEYADTHQVGLDQALIYLDKAIALDPNFAELYFERARIMNTGFGGRIGVDEARRETRRLINRYLELRPDSSIGWTFLGRLQMEEDRDLAAAEKSFRTAREVDPEFPWPISQLGFLAERRGRLDDAADYLKQSTMVDHSRPSHYFYGQLLLNMKRFDEAEQEFDLALRIDPTDLMTMISRVAVMYEQGNAAEGKRRFDAAWKRYGTTYPNAFVPVMVMAGHEAELRDLMKRWDEGTVATHTTWRLWAHMMLGEDDAAIDCLLRLIDEGHAPEFTRAGAWFEPLRANPRFAEVLAKLDASEVSH